VRYFTPTLILPPQGGGNNSEMSSPLKGEEITQKCPLPFKKEEKRDEFPFPNQVEVRFHGNDRNHTG